jgi:AcrR family transcriptional regulator
VIKCHDLDQDLTKRPPGRPARLSRDAVVTAALAIIDRDGIDALTMRRVAGELDSSTMALYRHVRDKDQLLVLMLDRLAATVAVPRFASDPRTRLRQACRAMRDGLARYPWVVDVLAQGDLIAPAILWVIEAIVSGFIACGVSEAEAVDGYRAIWQFTVGELITRRGIERTAALGRPPFVLQVLTDVDPEEFPTLAAVSGKWRPTRERDSYEIGLAALIDGLIGQAQPTA